MASDTASKATAAEKRKKALDLRRTGMSYDDIAKKVGYANKGSACRAVKQGLADITRESAKELLELELSRLDEVQAGLYDEAKKGDLWAVDRFLKLVDQRAKLTGLYNHEPEDDNIAAAAAALRGMVQMSVTVAGQSPAPLTSLDGTPAEPEAEGGE